MKGEEGRAAWMVHRQQFSLGAIYAARLLAASERLLTEDPSEATLFYVPLTVATVFHWPNAKQPSYKTAVSKLRVENDEVMKTVFSKPYFSKSGGCDHFAVVPRCAGGVIWAGTLGNLAQPTKQGPNYEQKGRSNRMAYLTIESPMDHSDAHFTQTHGEYMHNGFVPEAQRNWFTIPYPSDAAIQCEHRYSGGVSGHKLGPTHNTSHPTVSQTRVPALPLDWEATSKKRHHLITLVAGLRTPLRKAIARDCGARDAAVCFNPLAATRCHSAATGAVLMNTKKNPQCSSDNLAMLVMGSYGDSLFCFQPAGDTPTRKGLFDAVMAGCIPVLFGFNLFRSYSILTPEVSEKAGEWAVIFSSDEVRAHLFTHIMTWMTWASATMILARSRAPILHTVSRRFL
jgi:hypothetical protein